MPGCADCEVKCEKARKQNYKKFTHEACEYYPCHDFNDINCLFCFCPLYTFQDCGGTFTVLENGIKDCSNCQLPHTNTGYEYVVEFLRNNRA
jgi:Zn-finger protein